MSEEVRAGQKPLIWDGQTAGAGDPCTLSISQYLGPNPQWHPNRNGGCLPNSWRRQSTLPSSSNSWAKWGYQCGLRVPWMDRSSAIAAEGTLGSSRCSKRCWATGRSPLFLVLRLGQTAIGIREAQQVLCQAGELVLLKGLYQALQRGAAALSLHEAPQQLEGLLVQPFALILIGQ